MRRPFLLVLASAMMLSGCWWEGPAFFTGDPADAAPISPGLYRADDLDDSDGPETVRVEWLPDGSIRVLPQEPKSRDKTDLSQAVLHRFPTPGHDLWIIQYTIDKDPGSAVYGLLDRRGDILSVIPAIECDATADIVRKAGGSVKASGMAADDPNNPPSGQTSNLTCSFADRATLERAMAAYMATNPAFPTKLALKRIGN